MDVHTIYEMELKTVVVQATIISVSLIFQLNNSRILSSLPILMPFHSPFLLFGIHHLFSPSYSNSLITFLLKVNATQVDRVN